MNGDSNLVVTQVFRSAPPIFDQLLVANMQEAGYQGGEAAYRQARGGISQAEFLAEREKALAYFREALLGSVDFPTTTVLTPSDQLTPFNLAYFSFPYWNLVRPGDQVPFAYYRPIVYSREVRVAGAARQVQVAEHQLFVNSAQLGVGGVEAGQQASPGMQRLAGYFCNVGQDTPLPQQFSPAVRTDGTDPIAVYGYITFLPDAEHPQDEYVEYRGRNSHVVGFVVGEQDEPFGLSICVNVSFLCDARRSACDPAAAFPGRLTISRQTFFSALEDTKIASVAPHGLLWNAYNGRFPAAVAF